MTILIRREGPGAKSLIACNTCGEQEERLTCTIKKSVLHFCDMECKAEFAGVSKYSKAEHKHQEQRDRRDPKLKKQGKVKKRCTKCKRKYDGPPGGFPPNRDPEHREPGLCPVCSQRIPYDEGETAGVVRI